MKHAVMKSHWQTSPITSAKPFKTVQSAGRSHEQACWRKVGFGMKTSWISVVGVAFALISGCQCCPLFDCYANVIDDVSDTHVYFDRVYNPRFDITRMGKPDWCSPLNNHLCRRCCNNGCYDRYDECNLYPPQYPYQFPSNVMPAPTVRTKRIQRRLDAELMPSVERLAPAPAPASTPSTDQ